MKIVFEPLFQRRFLQIIDYIAKDKKSVATAFKKDLQLKISNLKTYPKWCSEKIDILSPELSGKSKNGDGDL